MAAAKGNNYSPGRPKGSKNKNSNKVSVGFAKDLVVDLIGTFKSGRFYVYKHIQDGEVVYIGKGKNNRAWHNLRSSDKHSDLMNNNEIDIRIIASDLSNEEALAIEMVLIKINNPIFNTVHSDSYQPLRIEFPSN